MQVFDLAGGDDLLHQLYSTQFSRWFHTLPCISLPCPALLPPAESSVVLYYSTSAAAVVMDPTCNGEVHVLVASTCRCEGCGMDCGSCGQAPCTFLFRTARRQKALLLPLLFRGGGRRYGTTKGKQDTRPFLRDDAFDDASAASASANRGLTASRQLPHRGDGATGTDAAAPLRLSHTIQRWRHRHRQVGFVLRR